MTRAARYAVIRVPQAIWVRVPPFVRAKDGWWYDLDSMPKAGRFEFGHTEYKAWPTGRFEVRDEDGAVAEVFEVRLPT